MSSSRLKLYNRACQICGEARLAALTDERPARYELDNIWANDGVKECLEQGQWQFGNRAVRIDYDTAIAPEFGYQRAFAKPDDYCATIAVCSDEYYQQPLLSYIVEAGYWYADLDTIYVQYVSNDSAFGGDLSRWPALFAEYVAQSFAAKLIPTLSEDKRKLDRILDPRNGSLHKSLIKARSHDRQGKPTRFPPESSWNLARRGGGFNNDRGNTGSLIG